MITKCLLNDYTIESKYRDEFNQNVFTIITGHCVTLFETS